MEKWKDLKLAELVHKLNMVELADILDVAIKEIPKIVNAMRISIYLIEDQHLKSTRHSQRKIQSEISEKIPIASISSLIPQALIKKKPLLISNVQEYIKKYDLEITLSKKQKYTSGSCIIVPLRVQLPDKQYKELGVLNITDKMDFTPFTKYDLYLATQVGDILATALHNYFVIEKKLGNTRGEIKKLQDIKESYSHRDMSLVDAKKRQAQLLPDLPKIQDYGIDVKYNPMDSVGGDFYDFIPISDDEIGIVVGDVSGHGMEAALVMSMAKQILRIYSKLYSSLQETLMHTNDEICNILKGEAFVTVFLGILNTKNHVLRYARAGHTYPIIYNPSRKKAPYELRTNGIFLGTHRSELFRSKTEEHCLQLIPGDVLLIYTDGIVENINAQGDEFSLNRIMSLLVESYDKNASFITHHLRKQILNFSDGKQFDDMTLMCLKTYDIKPGTQMNTMIVRKKQLEEADSFIIYPEFSYDEEAYQQIKSLELEISELKEQISMLTAGNSKNHQRQKEFCYKKILEEIIDSNLGYSLQVKHLVKKHEYDQAYNLLQARCNLATQQQDISHLKKLQKQSFFLSKTIAKYFHVLGKFQSDSLPD